MFEATVSIDLGASYTKVAYRPACVPVGAAPCKADAVLLMVGGSPLIPSLAIRTKRPGQPWVFGPEAANLKPGKDMEVFQNWKADLLRPENDKHSAAAVIVAEHFFGWLKKELAAAGIDLQKAQTRVAMPAFRTFDERAVLVARCMELNGWDSPLILKATEPHANTVGLFSKGRNVVGRTGTGELSLNYGQIFGNQSVWIQIARGFTLYGTHGNLFTAMILDVGAFTTDLAAVTFDVSGSENELSDGLRAIRQDSHALGVINDLDRPLFTELGSLHGFDWSELSFQEGEWAKRALYHGSPYALLPRPGVQVQLGGAGDDAIVARHVGGFTDAIWSKVAKFMEGGVPAVVYLTGGGVLIPKIAGSLQERFAKTRVGVGVVDDGAELAGEERVLLNANSTVRPWPNSGEGLHRVATALGGASVVLDASPAPDQAEAAQLTARAPLIILEHGGLVPCRCQGGNKDCCFCGGRGFYPRA